MATKKDLLPPDNLGCRQRALNKKVNDARTSNVDFAVIKDEIEVSEVDRIFKIDLAAKLKNIDYIIEMLKSGNTLYATRALKKSRWLYDDEYSHVINPEYLDINIFSVTSTRVKRIILKTVAMRVRREDRAIGFFKYCIDTGLPEIAFKYLLFTNESFKLDLMHNHNKVTLDKLKNKKIEYFQFIIGKSLKLLEAYLEMQDRNRSSILIRFKYLYAINNVKYLELCEKYDARNAFDVRLSNDIMTKHKERVLAKPLYYLEQVNTEVLFKNSTIDDLKIYITALMPSDANGFWGSWFLGQHSEYLDKIPHSEKYEFLKKTFCSKYPGEDFEMAKSFYTQHYYQYMTVAEQEKWAWNQIKSEKQVLGVGKDYIWYKFINFKEAFAEVKKIVMVTKEPERRKGIINVLIHSAKNDRDLETLFRYYHRKHSNELKSHKECFLEIVIDRHNVFEFDDACWDAFYTLLLGVELYNILDCKDSSCAMLWLEVKYTCFKNVVLFYHILHEKDMPERLSEYLLQDFYPESAMPELGDRDRNSILYLLSKLIESKRQFLYDFLLKFYIENITQLKNEPFTDEVFEKVERYSVNVQQLMNVFNPFRKNWKYESRKHSPKTRNVTNILSTQLLQDLKKDKTLVMDTNLAFKKRFENNHSNIDGFLKKIKIYFPDDVTKNFITLFEELLSTNNIDNKSLEVCVKAVLQLGDKSEIVEFMTKYAPENTKIDHNDIDPQQLRIQKAICRFACIPRPSVPLSTFLLYMKGDYVQYCLHAFNTYPVILPPSKCMEFVKALIDAPVSIQKHAFRLAFKCYDAQKLKQISLHFWNNTKNVSVRYVIYKGLFKRLVERNEEELFHALKPLTLELRDDDEKCLFSLLESNSLSDKYLGDHKEAAWTAVNKFKDKQPNIQRKCNLLSSIRDKIHLMRQEFVTEIVEDHVKLMLSENKLYVCHSSEQIAGFYIEKWNLTYTYILHFATTRDLIEKYLEIAHVLVKRCSEMWKETYDGNYIYQERIWDFFRQTRDKSLCHSLTFENSFPILESILKTVVTDLPLFESYMLRWELQLAIINRKVLKHVRQSFRSDEECELVHDSLSRFGEGVGKQVLNMVNDKIYFAFHTENVKDAICNNIKDLLGVIFAESDVDQASYINKALVTFTTKLLEFDIDEIYLLAIQILPRDCELCSMDGYQDLIDRIQKHKKPDVQYALHQKLNP